ncbi:DUF4012 domain-containing protein [Pseudarthrobacter enclensis]|uniref:DUF4012 domain-containing protein n=1 Tax=Pseudarthrobacter enclensis TaxID=993070 RepID=A0ABT9RXN5_9MICC|nr:DUF4012 domain-containing protein [Pseudarthrobacter enclensis]MDP9889827.1 hypothetical protein [Pseudarthrobacter enclensis]
MRRFKVGVSVRKKRWKTSLICFATFLLLSGTLALWLTTKAAELQSELTSAASLVPQLKHEIELDDKLAVRQTVDGMAIHTRKAADIARFPVWSMSTSLPLIGENFRAASELAISGNDVVQLAVMPLADSYQALDWDNLAPNHDGVDLAPLGGVRTELSAAAQAIRDSAARLGDIDSDKLLPQIRQPLVQATSQLNSYRAIFDTAADLASVAPEMMGSTSPRTYLLMIQNNAEARASGGIPGALAELSIDKGKLALDAQSSAGDLGIMSPVLPIDSQQQQIYSARMGKYMQDVNLTPDFPTAATTARAMWQAKTGRLVDGVISIDPVVLSYILQSTGPVSVNGPELAVVRASGLPTELRGDNVVPTLLSDVYAKITQPKLQDAYFAGVAKEVFSALSSGKGEGKGLVAGITRGAEEGRVLVWSANTSEQSVISKYALSGSISGPSVLPAQFGVYFNDGTGAKMDYYVKHTVQLVKECPADGYEQTMVRVTSTNTAPADAATSLPAYVTGGGAYGIAPGTVQTNIVTYGPVQSNVESANIDSQKTPFAPYLHANRPVGVIAQQLAPGESKTVEFTFGKIVQHTEPNVVVTPTVQPVKDVVLPTKIASCDKEQ